MAEIDECEDNKQLYQDYPHVARDERHLVRHWLGDIACSLVHESLQCPQPQAGTAW